MSRRSQLPSASVSAPVIGNGHVNSVQSPAQQDGPPVKRPDNQSRSVSLSKLPTLDSYGDSTDPDELFTKYTISEVKSIQQRLRRDADAKQEELRLMVGERYRDLLQASTSIISIAQSSLRVKQALKETRDAIISQEEPPLPQRPSIGGGADAHLHTLQLLSAHMKLLLDAPEHLWRLIERKKYFPAAWLFLLARVVHRALVRDDYQEGGTWSRQGVDVLEQFPLVQRQWDAVSQFRSQIIHKATMSLREYNATIEDTCAILLTLHLLDSRPLSETLSLLLGQRSKALNAKLVWKYEEHVSGSPASLNRHINGHVPEQNGVTSHFRGRPVDEVKEATHAALDIISRTVKAVRGVLQENIPQTSLIRRVLEYIHSDSPPTELTKELPTELYLTTQTLLMTLPSSAHFLLLPSSLKSYRPYVDLTSPSSCIHQSQLSQDLSKWFHLSSTTFRTAAEKWFTELHSIKEVWNVRSSTRKWVSNSDMEENEKAELIRYLDDLCRTRAIGIWRANLTTTLESFDVRLTNIISTHGNPDDISIRTSPVEYLFKAPPLPVLSQGYLGHVDISFQMYKTSLRQQIIGRTSLLDEVLATLENCARTIQKDLSHVRNSGDETRQLVDDLKQAYQPDADSFCASVIDKLELAAEIPIDNYSSKTDAVVLLSRVADELASTSPFILNIGCQQSAVKDFREKTVLIYDHIIDRWREHMITRIVNDYRSASCSRHPSFARRALPSNPSPNLVHSLLSLSNSIQQLSPYQNASMHATLVQTALRHFVTELTGDGWEEDDVQSLYDLAFLSKLAEVQGGDWTDLCITLNKRIEENPQSGVNHSDLMSSASESLARMQTLLATLLPRRPAPQTSEPADKFAALLPYGVPVLDQHFQPAIELAKPSSRFGLLLVGDT